MPWEEIVKFLGGLTVVVSAIAWVIQKLITTYLSAKLSEHKSELDKMNIEYKNNLDKTNLEHRVRFESLHVERAEVVRETYAKLTELNDNLGSILRKIQMAGEPPMDKKVRLLAESHNNLQDFFRPRRIYFDEETASLLDKILKAVISAHSGITSFPFDPGEMRGEKVNLKQRANFWDEARNIHENDIGPLKEKLEKTFRELLGVDT